jgi:hypothetical protein
MVQCGENNHYLPTFDGSLEINGCLPWLRLPRNSRGDSNSLFSWIPYYYTYTRKRVLSSANRWLTHEELITKFCISVQKFLISQRVQVTSWWHRVILSFGIWLANFCLLWHFFRTQAKFQKFRQIANSNFKVRKEFVSPLKSQWHYVAVWRDQVQWFTYWRSLLMQ